ncbi:glycosyltransferase family 4 protein [Bacillus salipaludis]|uniref:glycosyltransferase family 4 protein n=1 Tax=Bacillus salipaludis TaxID=2547811 RepID=UPI003D231ADA
MKILVVSQYYYPEQFRINDICETLVSLGNDVTVLTGLPNYPKGEIFPEYKNGQNRKQNINGVEVIRVPLVGRGKGLKGLIMNYLSFMLTSSLKSLFLSKKFDAVFVYQLSPVTMVLPAILYKWKSRRKVLLYCLDIWPESIASAGIKQSSILYKVLLKISKYLYKNVDQISVTSSSFKNYFADILKIDANNIKYLPQYAEKLYTQSSEGSLHRQQDSINLLFAGNIGEMQSVETIILAANELKDIGNLRWHIVGDGSAKATCEELVKKLNLQNYVIFHGQQPVSKMPEYFTDATALLVTLKDNEYISYTLPGKVQSYMAAGKPIIASINGETRKVIEESNCGLCCPAEDYISLAKIVRKFISDSNSHRVFSKNALNYYNKHFSKNAFINNLQEELNKLKRDV